MGLAIALLVSLGLGLRAWWQNGSDAAGATSLHDRRTAEAVVEVAPLPSVSAPPPPSPRAIEDSAESKVFDRSARPWVIEPPLSRSRFEAARLHASEFDPSAMPRLVEWANPIGEQGRNPIEAAGLLLDSIGGDRPKGSYRVEYSLDEALTEATFEILKKGRVARAHALILDPRNGRLLTYVSTDPESFPPERAYPSASIVKVLTAAALLEQAAPGRRVDCVYRGNKYRLNRRSLDRPKSGRASNLEEALATSNNRCFSQWALHDVGEERLLEIFDRFGWLAPAAPGHDPGLVEDVDSKLDLGRLGSGLDGVRVTPLHVAALASILTHGRWVEPWWIDRVVDERDESIPLPPRRADRPVLSDSLASRLRKMMVATTTRGTAKRAFRTRRGRSLLGPIRVAGKTGNLTGFDPDGRYEWFMGLAPAEDPKIAVVVLQLQSNLWWSRSTEVAARMLERVFCDRGRCSVENARRFTGDLGSDSAPRLMSELDRQIVAARGE